ncbi:MAG: tRNA (cytidine(34)-2'-O)-methyltransferase [Myxococcota bacterium]
MRAELHVVLVNPQIPQNTGSISRLCAATATHLHLVGELGFSLADRYLKRAGLDYWPHVLLHRHATLDECLAPAGLDQVAFYSSHGKAVYTAFRPTGDAWFVFGREADGLPPDLLAKETERTYSIPILPVVRSLNLANAVSIVLYDALSTRGFAMGGE